MPAGPPPRPRLALVALGCRANRADADAALDQVAGACDPAQAGAPADVVLVQTCAVTADAEAASRQAVRRAARDHPGARIVVAGCAAALAPEGLNGLPGVVAVAGPRVPEAVAEALRRLARGRGGAGPAAPGPAGVRRRARPVLKVQDGCDAACAYCAVPLARGPSRSLPFEAALARLLALGADHREVVLTGVHLGAYGRDLSPPRTLEELVAEAAARGLGARLRLSSVEPGEFPLGLLRRREVAALLCPHVHLPLQSGAPAVLEAMGRRGGIAPFRRAVEAVASLLPGAAVGTDLLVGFPGETDADHRATVALCEALPLAYLHVFPFSARPGTRAATLPGAVAPAIVRARARELQDLAARRWRAYLAAQAGRVLEAVVERVEGGLARGTAGNRVALRWPAGPEPRGALVRVRVTGDDGLGCAGERVAAPAGGGPPGPAARPH